MRDPTPEKDRSYFVANKKNKHKIQRLWEGKQIYYKDNSGHIRSNESTNLLRRAKII